MHLPRKRCGLLVCCAASLITNLALAQISPEASIKTFKVADGLQCTLFAAEPMLVNPCDIDVDAQGRVWVCEGAGPPAKLIWEVPTKMEQIDVPFVFEDVPLPW